MKLKRQGECQSITNERKGDRPGVEVVATAHDEKQTEHAAWGHVVVSQLGNNRRARRRATCHAAEPGNSPHLRACEGSCGQHAQCHCAAKHGM